LNRELLALLCLISLSFSIYIPPSSLPDITISPIAVSASPYVPKLLDSREIAEKGSSLALYEIKATSYGSSIAALFKVADGPNSYTRMSHYIVSGSPGNIAFKQGYDIKYPGSEHTNQLKLAQLATGDIAVGGRYYSSNSGTRPYLASMEYSSAKFKDPVLLGVSGLPYGNGGIIEIARGNLIGDSYPEVVGCTDFAKSFLFIRNTKSTEQISYNFSGYLSSAQLAIGNFAPASGNEIAMLAKLPGDTSTSITLFKIESGKLAKINSLPALQKNGGEASFSAILPADVDGDSYDELLAAGSYKKGGSLYTEDLLQVYDYGAGGWSLAAEYKNATPGGLSAFSKELAFQDINGDGKKEIVAINIVQSEAGSKKIYTAKAAYFNYDSSKKSLLLLASAPMGDLPQDENNYQDYYHTFAFGDFNADGKLDIVAYYNEVKSGQATDKLALYTIDVPSDIAAPKLSIVSPAGASAYNNSSITISFTYSDANPMQSSAGLVRLYSKQRDSGWQYAAKSQCNPSEPGCVITYGKTISLLSYPAGNYTIYAKANDSYGNEGFASKQFAILATPAKSIIPGGLPSIPLLPNVTIPLPGLPPSPLNETQEEPATEEQQPDVNVPPEEPAPSGQTAPQQQQAPPTDAEKAQQAVKQLENSITEAKKAGADTASAEEYLEKAQSSLSSGDYSQASMNADRGETLVKAALARIGASPPQPFAGTGRQPSSTAPAIGEQPGSGPTQSPQPSLQQGTATDYTPYYVGVGALVVLAVAYMFTHKPQPPADQGGKTKKSQA